MPFLFCDRYDATPADYISMIVTDYGMVSQFFNLIWKHEKGYLLVASFFGFS